MQAAAHIQAVRTFEVLMPLRGLPNSIYFKYSYQRVVYGSWMTNELSKYRWDASQPVLTLLRPLLHCPVCGLHSSHRYHRYFSLSAAKGWSDHPAHGLQHSGDGSVKAQALDSQHCSHALDGHLEVTNNCCYNWLKSKRRTDGSWHYV